MAKILGIDLGTTNSVVAVYDGGEPKILSPSPNRRTTPSIVAFCDDGSRLIGDPARNQQVTNPESTVYSIKRFVGRRQNEVSSEEKLVPYTVVGKPSEYVRVSIGHKKYTPQEISAMILRELKEIAEEQLGETCDRAIITVPAYFNDAQRQATQDAAEIAGFKVERTINEPTAAALAYGVERRGDRNIVIFDFGGGTFDLSAMRIGSGTFEVLAVHGNTHLGGDDFDQRIIDIVAEDFLRKHCIDVRKDPMALQRLKQEAQKAKAELSDRIETDIMVPFICMDASGPKHLEYSLNRARFEAICDDLFDELRRACRTLLTEAGLQTAQIADVVMVGGSTRIPKVQQITREVFQTAELDKSINPDEAVALGAAILGGVIQGDLHNVHLMDVTSHGFGVEEAGGKMLTLMPKNTPIPTTVKKVFSTPKNYQSSVPIIVLEGEAEQATDNRPLGVFRLTGIRRAPRGVPRIEVEFKIDPNGILNVSATDQQTGRSQKITVTGACGLDEAEMKRMKQENKQKAEQAEQRTITGERRIHAEGVLTDMNSWLQYHKQFIPPKSVDRLEAVLGKLELKIKKGDTRGIRAAMKKLDELSAPYRQAG
ncbi:MAG: molecular chaperone DnaK [Phycisphaeraceae bacterium]